MSFPTNSETVSRCHHGNATVSISGCPSCVESAIRELRKDDQRAAIHWERGYLRVREELEKLKSDPVHVNAHVLFAALERVTNQLVRDPITDQDEAWVQARVALAKAAGGAA
jgi:hypothetical protein